MIVPHYCFNLHFFLSREMLTMHFLSYNQSVTWELPGHIFAYLGVRLWCFLQWATRPLCLSWCISCRRSSESQWYSRTPYDHGLVTAMSIFYSAILLAGKRRILNELQLVIWFCLRALETKEEHSGQLSPVQASSPGTISFEIALVLLL